MSILSTEVLTHVPSMVARTLTCKASPSRFVFAMSFQAAWGSVTPQPVLAPPRTGTIASHFVSTVTWVIEFVKSTSKRFAPLGGTNCTSSTFMFGGSSRPSSG